MSKKRNRNMLLVTLTLMLTLSILAACGPATQPTSAPTTEPPQVEETTPPQPEITAAPAVEAKNLLLWDAYTEMDEGKAKVMEAAIAEFETKYPGTTITREVQDFENMKTLLKTALASGTGPDIVVFAPGAGFMGPLVDAELLLPLNEYQEQYGWKDRIYPWTWDSVSFDGNVYGIGNELEMIGVYYNNDLFTELGLTPPTTLEEYVQIADKCKAAGYIPIAFANKPGWPAFHTFSAYANNLAGKEGMDAVFASEKPWTDPEFVQSIQIPFVDQNQAGYFIPSPNAVDYQEGNELFYSGQTCMHLTGMWLLGDILANSEFEVGFFALPAPEGKETMPPGGMGSAVMASAATKSPDEAAAFMDILFSEEFAKNWYEMGAVIPPINVDPTGYEMNDLFRFFVNTIREASQPGSPGLGYNIDVLTPPEFNTVMLDGFQAVLNGDRTPEEQAQALQEAWEAANK